MTKMVFWNCPIIPHNRSVKNKHQNTAERLTVLGQFCKLIPKYGLASVCSELNKEGIKIAVRAFSIWSHVVSMIYCHMAHCISLNDICDGLQNYKGNLNDIRNATAPHRTTLSHANRTRDVSLIKKLFWKTVEYYRQTHPKFFDNVVGIGTLRHKVGASVVGHADEQVAGSLISLSKRHAVGLGERL